MKNTLTASLIIAGLVFNSCSQIDEPTPSKEEFAYSSDMKVRYNGKYLEFASTEALDETIEFFETADQAEIDAWKNQFDFESFEDIYRAAQYEQYLYEEMLISKLKNELSEEELSKTPLPTFDLQPMVAQNMRLFEFDESNRIMGMNLFRPNLAPILNSQGILKVNGHLFQYNGDNSKIILEGDASLISQLDNITQSTAQVIVDYVLPGIGDGESNSRRNFNQTGHGKNAGYEIYLTAKIHTYTRPIYGPEVCRLDCPGEEKLKRIAPSNETAINQPIKQVVDPSDCFEYCYRPIIGTQYTRTVYSASTNCNRLIINWFNTGWKTWVPEEYVVNVRYKVNGVKQRAFSSLCSNSGTARSSTPGSDVNFVIYDGPAINVTYGHHQATAVTSSLGIGTEELHCEPAPYGYPGYRGWISHLSSQASPDAYVEFSD
ncbi:hypothetical protein SAMN04488029_2887 [Reichenbachiella faecimaris]|uniref:DUF4848 domain-containing protein n=1 Tax=Reichenbachiella faecimaris TaxID=692418 RepID=A0A1W2GJH8_REIFA|nr:hypothetical protein [Reichenbachiella faecimaris]SMD36416.1 hypothetical protein SAMN04488029_2887 [Reichenbachiella faecimaris]